MPDSLTTRELLHLRIQVAGQIIVSRRDGTAVWLAQYRKRLFHLLPKYTRTKAIRVKGIILEDEGLDELLMQNGHLLGRVGWAVFDSPDLRSVPNFGIYNTG